jgi:beta-glucosidase
MRGVQSGMGECVSRTTGRRSWIGRGLLAFGLVLALLDGCSASEPVDAQPTHPANSAIIPTARHDPQFARRMRELKAMPDRGSIELVFLGDSITQRWESQGADAWMRHYGWRAAANFGINGDRTQNVLWRLREGSFDGLSPRLVVLLIGTNNSESNTAQEVAEGVASILESLRERVPDSKVLLLALFPKHSQPRSASRAKIVAINALLPQLADGERVYFLDVGEVFVSADGWIERKIMPDGLHLSPKGYGLWAKAMEPTLARLLGAR